MSLTEQEKRENIRTFVNQWQARGREKQDDQQFWHDFFKYIFDIDATAHKLEFQKPVKVDGNTKFIDIYVPDTKVVIEQKTLGVDLSKPAMQSDEQELTPYRQAKRYRDELPDDEQGRWIITCNFNEFWIYDGRHPGEEPIKVALTELPDKYHYFKFLVKQEFKDINEEVQLSIEAGKLVGKLYDALRGQYADPDDPETLKSLNKLCVRLVFLFYGEDEPCVFGKKNIFRDYLNQDDFIASPRAAKEALIRLFRVLNQDYPRLAQFKYVNGDLFKDDYIEIPPLTQEIVDIICNDCCRFDWSKISPTIFGAVFESTLNPETRRKGGMHYTSIENIHKVIDPLFLDELKKDLDDIKNEHPISKKRLLNFQDKLANLKFMDPACGSGNFLTETYVCIRRLENEVLKELRDLEGRKGRKTTEGQVVFGEADNPVKVSINQFYGIEINDFAVTVARTALWIAEAQMLKETEDIVLNAFEFLPLTTNASIVEANALRIDWEDVLPASECDYIMGNPPFVGYSNQSKEQKEDMLRIYVDENEKSYKAAGKIDYVSNWYFLASKYIYGTDIEVAFVSTNSICQGEQVAFVWEPLFARFDIHINFAYKTFRWDSEAQIKAHVHCVIIGFSCKAKPYKYLFENDKKIKVNNINTYLIDAPNVFVHSVSKPICNSGEMTLGNLARDDGNLSNYQDSHKKFICDKYYGIDKFFRPILGAAEFLNNKKRWCLWLDGVNPNEYRKFSFIVEKINEVRKFREKSTRKATRDLAAVPYRFAEIRQPMQDYLMFPLTSSEKRRYVPIGFISRKVISTNACSILPDTTMYRLGVLTSNVHNSWMRLVAGRLEMRYRYSNIIVFNTFPWPGATAENLDTPVDELVTPDTKAKIEQTAQAILDARALYPESSLADLYDPLTMPTELLHAHQNNDRAVMSAYGMDVTNTSEADCVAHLMKMYQELVK